MIGGERNWKVVAFSFRDNEDEIGKANGSRTGAKIRIKILKIDVEYGKDKRARWRRRELEE